MQRRHFTALAAATLAAPAAFAQQQDRTVRILVGFPPGGSADVIARLVADKMRASLGQNVIVDNKPGAGGLIAASEAARAPADGYTLMLGATNNFTINQHLYKLSFDPVSAFEPVTIIFDVPFIMYASTTVPARTVQEVVAYAKANPGKLNYASSGAGTPPHLAGEMVSALADIRMTHVPYKAAAQSIAALLAGEVHFYVGLVPGAQQHIDAGRIRVLATATPQRVQRHPEAPSAREAGFPTMNISTWWAFVAPKGTPKAVVDKLHQAVESAVREPAVRERYAQLGMVPVANRPAEFAAQIKAEAAAWGEFIRNRNIRIE